MSPSPSDPDPLSGQAPAGEYLVHELGLLVVVGALQAFGSFPQPLVTMMPSKKRKAQSPIHVSLAG